MTLQIPHSDSVCSSWHSGGQQNPYDGEKMAGRQQTDYQRIEKAIAYINANFRQQPSLETVAAAVNLSPFHFQRLFTEWAGVSPKKFTQYMSLDYAKSLLANRQGSLLDTAYETGLSGTGRLHDLFVNIEGMTPGEYKSRGMGLVINYHFEDSLFGKMIVASTDKGVCYMAFENDENLALTELKSRLPNANYRLATDEFQQNALRIFRQDWNQLEQIKLHLAGTPFQLKVWESLLNIPSGGLTTYGDIAKELDKPKASRAVGTAVGANPVSFLIPCHRVIQGSGKLGGYRWGVDRKSAMIGWEAAQLDKLGS